MEIVVILFVAAVVGTLWRIELTLSDINNNLKEVATALKARGE